MHVVGRDQLALMEQADSPATELVAGAHEVHGLRHVMAAGHLAAFGHVVGALAWASYGNWGIWAVPVVPLVAAGVARSRHREPRHGVEVELSLG